MRYRCFFIDKPTGEVVHLWQLKIETVVCTKDKDGKFVSKDKKPDAYKKGIIDFWRKERNQRKKELEKIEREITKYNER